MKATIALNQIEKIEIYQNTKRYYKEKIKSLTGCDYILNGAFFSGRYKPLQTLKVNGNLVVKDPRYSYDGYGWNIGSDIHMTQDYANCRNFICCMGGLKDGRSQTMYYNPDVAGSRPRTAMGLTKDSLVLYCDKAGKTPEQVRDILKSMGCLSCVVLDGGGSTQGNFDGMKVNSSENNGNGRICYSYILVYLKKNTVFPMPPNTADKENCPYIEPVTLVKNGTRGNSAKWVQWYLNKHGANLAVDGIFGNMSVLALKLFQKDNGLTVDGICGAMTRAKLKAV